MPAYLVVSIGITRERTADASPDGDALQAFEWASNPPGEVCFGAQSVASSVLLNAAGLRRHGGPKGIQPDREA